MRATKNNGDGVPSTSPLTDDQINNLGAVFRVLSDIQRLRILNLLRSGEKNVTGIREALGMQQSLVIHHLSLLRVSSLIQQRRAGRFVYHSLTDRAADALSLARTLI